ncbi:hypothetical protein [Luteococcus peritonei]|uniref:Uncharacterized protein n=1 Tax=Luteococcus peritonei TaxID=88874 RepID=A0ABW4RT71_9ACTN
MSTDPYVAQAVSHEADQKWDRSFEEQMRLRGATGTSIGDALAMIDSHCQETGESRQQAFGDPARQAGLLHPGGLRPHGWLLRQFLPSLLTVVTLNLSLPNVGLDGRAIVPLWGVIALAASLPLVLTFPWIEYRMPGRKGSALQLATVGILLIVIMGLSWTHPAELHLDLRLVKGLSVLFGLLATLSWSTLNQDPAIDPRRPRSEQLVSPWLKNLLALIPLAWAVAQCFA